MSGFLLVTKGVPQGIVTGPVLTTSYVDSVSSLYKRSNKCLANAVLFIHS